MLVYFAKNSFFRRVLTAFHHFCKFQNLNIPLQDMFRAYDL
jgi:hypothetical protein